MTNSIVRKPSIPPSGTLAPNMLAVWYPAHEAPASVGTTIADALSNGPVLTLSSAVGTTWSANAGWLTYSGSNFFQSPRGNAYLGELCRLDNISGQQLLIGYELMGSGALTGSETMINWGRQRSTDGVGGWMCTQNTAEQPGFQFMTLNGGAVQAIAFSGQARQTINHWVGVYEVVGTSATTADVWHGSIDLTTGIILQGFASITDLLNGGGSAPPGTDGDCSLILGAREISIGSIDRFCSSAGGAVKTNNTWIARNPTIDTTLALRCLEDMVAARREFPRSLRG